MRNSRIVPIALILIIIAIVIAALISLARTIFFPSGTQTTSQSDTSQQALLDTAINHSVAMTVRGPIVANENFHSYTMTISPSSRTLTGYTGYTNTPIDQGINLGNNPSAYEQFVYALDKVNYASGTELTGSSNDLRGVCATGDVYQFSILKDNKSVKTLWTSACGNTKGSLSAKLANLTLLFDAQIPQSQVYISNIAL
jgi:hypothetical protein